MTRYVRPYGQGYPGGDGSLTQPFDGWYDLHNRGLALSPGEDIEYLADRGPYYMLNEQAAVPANAWAFSGNATTGWTSGSLWGPVCGSSQGAGSTASNRTFRFTGSTGTAVFDGRGGGATNRVSAVLTFKGENIVLQGPLIVRAPDWNYLFDEATGATRVPWNAGIGVGDATLAEQVSHENGGIIAYGQGITIDSIYLLGSDSKSAWCRYGIQFYAHQAGSANKKNYIRNCRATGCMTGIMQVPFGVGGYTLPAGCSLEIYKNQCFAPAWGQPRGFAADEYNAGQHGNGIETSGAWGWRLDIHDNEIQGNWQDGIDMGTTWAGLARYNYVHDIGDTDIKQWQWNSGSSAWFLVHRAQTEGNGIKLGLNAEGTGATSPSSWLAADGVSGSSSLLVSEQFNAAIGNRIYRCSQAGMTTNAGRGMFIHGNEIIDTIGKGIDLFSASGVLGNNCLTHNYVSLSRKAASGTAALYVQAGMKLVLINNVLRSDPTVSGQLDLYWSGTNQQAPTFKDKNLLVTGRTAGTIVADASGNLAIPAGQTVDWTPGKGFAAGSAYHTAGRIGASRYSRMAMGDMDMLGRPLLGELGCYAAPFSRSART